MSETRLTAAEPVPATEGLPHTDYGAHTWLELRELAARDDVVVVIPTATLEDHGYHLPIDTDVRLIEAIATAPRCSTLISRAARSTSGALEPWPLRMRIRSNP